MRSDKIYLLGFGYGLGINANKNKNSIALASANYFNHPYNTGNLIKANDGGFYFAGGYDYNFICVDLEIWDLN